MDLFSTFRLWYEDGKPALVGRTAALGMASGLASWLLIYAVHLAAGTPDPGMGRLILALFLGALCGAILALILAMRWDRRSGTGP